jgi:hypothetical protein
MEISRRSKIFFGIGVMLLISTAIAGVIILSTKKPVTLSQEIEQVPVSYTAPIIDEEAEDEQEETPADEDYAAEYEALSQKYKNKQYDAILGGVYFTQSSLVKILAEPSEYSVEHNSGHFGTVINMYGAELVVSIPYESYGLKLESVERLSSARFPEFTNLFRTVTSNGPRYQYISHVSLNKECNFFESNTQPPCANNGLAFLRESTELEHYVLSMICDGTAENCDKAVSRLSIDSLNNTSDVIESRGAYRTMLSKAVARPGTYSIQSLNEPVTYSPASYPVPNREVPGTRYQFYELGTDITIFYQDYFAPSADWGYTKVNSNILNQSFEELSYYRPQNDSGISAVFQSNVKTSGTCTNYDGSKINAPCADQAGVKMRNFGSTEDTYLTISCKGTPENCVKSLERIMLVVYKNNNIYY